MAKYGLADKGVAWDQAIKTANRFLRDSDSKKITSNQQQTNGNTGDEN